MSAISSVFGALKYVPATVARKALEKVNPKFKNYFSSAVAYGVDANHALDFLVDRFESGAQKQHRQNLERGEANQTLRPDEKASLSQIRNSEIPGKIAKGAASIGLGALAGGIPGAIGQAMPQQGQQQIPNAGGEESPLGNLQGEHIPGLGQLQAEHGPKQLHPREAALKHYNQMSKRKKLIDKLSQDFENYYGPAQEEDRLRGINFGSAPSSGQGSNEMRAREILAALKRGGR